MFVTAVCFRLLLNLKWPKNKNNYDARLSHIYIKEHLTCQLYFLITEARVCTVKREVNRGILHSIPLEIVA